MEAAKVADAIVEINKYFRLRSTFSLTTILKLCDKLNPGLVVVAMTLRWKLRLVALAVTAVGAGSYIPGEPSWMSSIDAILIGIGVTIVLITIFVRDADD